MMLYYENSNNLVIKWSKQKERKRDSVVYKEIEGKAWEIKKLRKGQGNKQSRYADRTATF